MRTVLLIAVLLHLPLWAETANWGYHIDQETWRVTRIAPTIATEGPDVERWQRWANARRAKGCAYIPFVVGYSPNPLGKPSDASPGKTAGTPEKDTPEDKTPDKGKDEGNKEAEPDWPPKEVAPAADKGWEPTEEELEQLRKLCAAGKNSGDNKKFDEARDLSWKMLRRLARAGDKRTTAEWAKRLEAAARIREAMKDAKSYSSGNGDVCNVMVDDIATEEKHPDMFAKLKWMYDNRAKFDIQNRYYRIAVYKYIENHPDAFKDAAAKKLFCVQIMKGGVNDPGIKELSESFK